MTPAWFDRVYGALEGAGYIVAVLGSRKQNRRIIRINRPASQTLEFRSEALAGRPFTDLTAPDADAKAVGDLLDAADRDQAHHTRLLCQKRSGSKVWLELNVMPVASDDDEQEDALVLIFGHDATEAMREEEHSRAVQGLLAKIFMDIAEPIYLTDSVGRFVMVNASFERLVGSKPGALIGHQSLGVYAKSGHAALAAAREQQQIDGLDYTVATQLLTEEGERSVRLSVTMVRRSLASRFRIVHVHLDAVPAPAPPPPITAAASVQFIGLNEIRKSLGSRWPELAERVYATSERILRKRLRRFDTVTGTGDGGFMVGFVGLTEDEAAVQAADIGHEIRTQLQIDGAPSEITDIQSIAIAMPNVSPDLSAKKFNALVQQRVAGRIGDLQNKARANLGAALAQLDYVADPVLSRTPNETIGLLVSSDLATENAIKGAISVLPSTETKGLYVDAIRLRLAQTCALECAVRAPKELIFVPLGAEILLSKQCLAACIDVCRSIPDSQRQQIVLIVDIPADVALVRLASVIELLRPFCRSVAAGIGTPTQQVPNAGIMKISLLTLEARSFLHLADWRAAIKDFVARARLQKCSVLVRGAPAGRVADLVGEGVSLIATSNYQQAPRAARPPSKSARAVTGTDPATIA